eukprot:Skav231014  [mRNA]  locus=scaffold1196:99576:103576:- [translate_table: standard]
MEDLQCDYLDLYMIHWPVPEKHVDAYKAAPWAFPQLGTSLELVKLKEEDLAELQAAGLPLPTVNQIECAVDLATFWFASEVELVLRFEPISVKEVKRKDAKHKHNLAAQVVAALATKHGRTPSQILGRWLGPQFWASNAVILDLDKLENLTSEASLETFKSTYQKCVLRDTPLEARKELAKSTITVD